MLGILGQVQQQGMAILVQDNTQSIHGTWDSRLSYDEKP